MSKNGANIGVGTKKHTCAALLLLQDVGAQSSTLASVIIVKSGLVLSNSAGIVSRGTFTTCTAVPSGRNSELTTSSRRMNESELVKACKPAIRRSTRVHLSVVRTGETSTANSSSSGVRIRTVWYISFWEFYFARTSSTMK
jgi:hypothetical protein